MCGLAASAFLESRYILAMVASFEDGEVEGDGDEEVGVVMEVAIDTGNRCWYEASALWLARPPSTGNRFSAATRLDCSEAKHIA